MRPTALSFLVVAFACSNPIDPQTADLSGTVQAIEASANRIGINSGKIQCFTAPCFDYSAHVTGKVYQETGDGDYREISFAGIPNGSTVLVWTTGVVMESYPGQVEARRVVVRNVATTATKNRAPR